MQFRSILKTWDKEIESRIQWMHKYIPGLDLFLYAGIAAVAVSVLCKTPKITEEQLMEKYDKNKDGHYQTEEIRYAGINMLEKEIAKYKKGMTKQEFKQFLRKHR